MPLLSVVVLTRNEAHNLGEALASLLAQEGPDLEVIVVDGASADGTPAVARAYASRDERVRLIEAGDASIGACRNLGIEASRGRIVAQMSADATAAPGWAAALAAALDAGADVVFGRQEHAPPSLSPAAVVRGLRYHHFRSDATLPPETYASNVNAAVRREVLDRVRFVSDGPASALDDILFTREAKGAGFRIAYEPRMLVRHKDATTLAGEWRKNRREGYGWGILAPALGLSLLPLAWGGALLVGLAALLVWPSLPALALLGLLLYAPTLRRVLRAGGPYVRRAPLALAAATLASPVFDLSFAYHYALGLVRRRRDLTGLTPPAGGIPR